MLVTATAYLAARSLWVLVKHRAEVPLGLTHHHLSLVHHGGFCSGGGDVTWP